jgi:hypothetical protein
MWSGSRVKGLLRHTSAFTVLEATKDLRKVSLWLGHAHMQTTQIYTRADPSVKLETLESGRTSETSFRPLQGYGQADCVAKGERLLCRAKKLKITYRCGSSETDSTLNAKLRGHYQYYGRPTNYPSLGQFYRKVLRIWREWLSRRTRGRRMTWERFVELRRQHPLLSPRIMHA